MNIAHYNYTDKDEAIEVYVDALDHIRRVASSSRSMSRRNRWIAGRADCALTGNDWKELEYPRMKWDQYKLRTRVEALEKTMEQVINLLGSDSAEKTIQQIRTLCEETLQAEPVDIREKFGTKRDAQR